MNELSCRRHRIPAFIQVVFGILGAATNVLDFFSKRVELGAWVDALGGKSARKLYRSFRLKRCVMKQLFVGQSLGGNAHIEFQSGAAIHNWMRQVGRGLFLQVGLGQSAIDAVPTLENEARQLCPVFFAVAGLGEQAEVTVCGFTQILVRYRRCPA